MMDATVTRYPPILTNLCGWNAGVETMRLATYAVTLVYSTKFRDPDAVWQCLQTVQDNNLVDKALL